MLLEPELLMVPKLFQKRRLVQLPGTEKALLLVSRKTLTSIDNFSEQEAGVSHGHTESQAKRRTFPDGPEPGFSKAM